MGGVILHSPFLKETWQYGISYQVHYIFQGLHWPMDLQNVEKAANSGEPVDFKYMNGLKIHGAIESISKF